MNTRRVVNTVIYLHPSGKIEDAIISEIKESGLTVISVRDVIHANTEFYLHEPETVLFAVDFEVGDQQGLDFVRKLVDDKRILKSHEVALVSGDFEVRELATRHDFNFFDKGDGAFVEELIKVAKNNATKKGPRLSGVLSDDTPVAV